MPRHRVLIAHLSLADSENVFFITIINFDLPTIKTGMNQELGWRIKIGGQEVSGIAIVGARMLREFVRNGSDYDQAQLFETCSTSPQNVLDLFVSNKATLTSDVNQRY
jgi:hypothetical protein